MQASTRVKTCMCVHCLGCSFTAAAGWMSVTPYPGGLDCCTLVSCASSHVPSHCYYCTIASCNYAITNAKVKGRGRRTRLRICTYSYSVQSCMCPHVQIHGYRSSNRYLAFCCCSSGVGVTVSWLRLCCHTLYCWSCNGFVGCLKPHRLTT